MPIVAGSLEKERNLPSIVEQQSRQHDPVPGGADRITADVAHVSIHCFGAGHRQKDPTEHGDPVPAVPGQQRDPVARIGGGDHRGIAANAGNTERGEDCEPQQHYRPERLGDLRGPAALDGEQAEQDRHCN